jgi:tRNA G37 N-methylase Trm5
MPESILMRIIAVSSNPGEVVFDPFAGSGTTAAAACLLGRKYSGVDISADYVKNMKKRLGEIKKQVRNYETLFVSFDGREVLELRRLYQEMSLSCGEILTSKKLLGVFTRQFEIRMNNSKTYAEKDVAMVLMEFAV